MINPAADEGYGSLNNYLYRRIEGDCENMELIQLDIFTVLFISNLSDIPQCIPLFIPLFVLAFVPVIFKGQYYGMSEMEAVTRASGAQIMLAKLVLARSANLVCITILLFMELYQQKSNCFKFSS